MKRWYASSTGNHQGLVIEEGTGRSVAVTYDKADAPLVAAAPALRDALEILENLCSNGAYPGTEDLIQARAALAQTKETT